MELRHLRYFVAVAEELNFTRAAERLGIGQPPLSLQIRQLEEELGTQLFRRKARGVELTPAGKLLLEEARIILRQVEQAETGVRRRARGETGRVILGSGGATYFHPLIPAIIREFSVRYPDVVLHPQASSTALLMARLHAGQIDAAFVRPSVDDSEGLALHLLVDEPMVMVVPKHHPLGTKSSAPLRSFTNEPFILYARELNPDYHDRVIAACRDAGFEPRLGPQAPQILPVIPMVAAGLGVSIVPESTRQIRLDGVVYLEIEGKVPRSRISLAHRRDDRSAPVRNLVAIARRVAGGRTGAAGEGWRGDPRAP
ncbi:LysR family transcriptional regulator [Bradyrhizobium sp.]|jgi:DNA-binding transcriptional LysR family regulator|uniref:LysR family transcriptional regulator n=1 Tax=Bradyrhizobium sp. TaxID=376 RepID=UPI002DFD7587|nr:LysR family transcriptional regulator [Bradyrhizobium sp.]